MFTIPPLLHGRTESWLAIFLVLLLEMVATLLVRTLTMCSLCAASLLQELLQLPPGMGGWGTEIIDESLTFQLWGWRRMATCTYYEEVLFYSLQLSPRLGRWTFLMDPTLEPRQCPSWLPCCNECEQQPTFPLPTLWANGVGNSSHHVCPL